MMSNQSSNMVTASQAPSQLAELGSLVYALGTLGYDFGTEARRDSFKQLMPANEIAGTMVPANPYDARQMVDHLGSNLAEARSLIWTLNIELTPVYAIEPKGPFAREIYQVLQQLLSGQIQPEDSEDYVERVSIPGVLTGKTVKLFSGQVVPLIEPQNTRGLYGWKVNTLVNAAMQVVTDENEADEETMRRTLGSFLNRVYYDLRNLGTTSQDRALNFSVTNAFQAASTFGQAVAEGMELDSVTVEKSPFCRMDSDCWDVKLKFFDPENNRRAKKIYRFTIDVSDLIPVTLGEVRSWSSPF
jgi:cyanobactin maturation PatA/PatG family protease